MSKLYFAYSLWHDVKILTGQMNRALSHSITLLLNKPVVYSKPLFNGILIQYPRGNLKHIIYLKYSKQIINLDLFNHNQSTVKKTNSIELWKDLSVLLTKIRSRWQLKFSHEVNSRSTFIYSRLKFKLPTWSIFPRADTKQILHSFTNREHLR